MSKHEESELILKLYDLRREEKMRHARDWFFRDFNPESAAEIVTTMFGDNGGYFRMVISYWDMAAAIVNHGGISVDLFNETNGEHFIIFTKLEPFLAELRGMFGPQMQMNLEKLIDATPGGRERVATTRERMKAMRAKLAETAQAKAAEQG